MRKMKNLTYGIVFGLAIFGLVMMSVGNATAEHTSSVDRCWETEESGAWAVRVGYKGVGVEYWREYEDEHGAHIASAVRAEFGDGGLAEWWSTDMASTSSDRHSSTGANYYWDVEEFSFCPVDGYQIYFQNFGMLHVWEFDYVVTEERDTWWPWGDYEEEYDGTLTCNMYASFW